MNNVLLVTGTVTERGARLFSGGKYWFKRTGSHCGAFAPAGPGEGSSLPGAVCVGGCNGPSPAPLTRLLVCFPTYIKLCWDAGASRAARDPLALWFPGARWVYGPRGYPPTVTNALFDSEMQHYGSLGRCNGNLGGCISCPRLPAEGINPVLHCSQLHGPRYECTTGTRGDGAIQYGHWWFFQQRSFCICLLLLLLLMRL